MATNVCDHHRALKLIGRADPPSNASHFETATYERRLSSEPDPHDLLISYPSEPMTMWPISMRVNAPENDDPSLLDRTMDQSDWQSPLTTIPGEKRSMR